MWLATKEDIPEIATMLFAMYNELEPELASKDIGKYVELSTSYLADAIVYIDELDRSLLILKDSSSPVINRKTYECIIVYIKPGYRKTRLLSKMYSYVFKQFTNDILGFVYPQSDHLKVLEKRHHLVGYIYRLNRS